MTFTKGSLSYEKRPLTKDIALRVISKKVPSTREELDEFTTLAYPYKSGELAAQVDSCPVAKLDDLRESVGFLKQTYEGFRIRHAQLSGIAAVDENIEKIDDETAEHLIASGSIAVIARKFEGDSDKVLLRHGILPLISGEELKENTFVLIRNIRNEDTGIETGELEAYVVTPHTQVSVNIKIDNYEKEELNKIL